MKGCRAPVHFSKKEDNNPHLYYKDSFSLHPKNELGGSNTWVGHWKKHTVTVTQQHHHSDITAEDIQIEYDPSPDGSISVYFPKDEIAKALNDFLNETFA